MRQVKMVTLLVGIFLLIMQCSTNESLEVFNGRMETVCDTIAGEFSFAPYIYRVRTDSIRWVYEYPSGGPSRANLIVSGQIKTDSIDPLTGVPINILIGQNHLDLGVETHTDAVPGIVQLAFDSVGNFLDTIQIAFSPLSGLILPSSSRLFVNKVIDASTTISFDTIPIVDAHAAGGQR
jgi:hypothetical protein